MNCPICQSKYNIPFVEDLLKCEDCSHIYKNRPIPKEVYKEYVNSAHIIATPQHEVNAKHGANVRFRMFNTFAKKGSVLEIGCGHKYFLDILKRNGYKPEGTELSKTLIKEINHKIHYGNPSEIADLKTYDNICAFHVLEHMNEPVKEVSCLVNHMSDDGVFCFEIPCMNFYTKENLDSSRFYEVLHTQFFNQESINLLLNNCGLVIVCQMTFWDGPKIASMLVCAVKQKSDLSNEISGAFAYMRGE